MCASLVGRGLIGRCADPAEAPPAEAEEQVRIITILVGGVGAGMEAGGSIEPLRCEAD